MFGLLAFLQNNPEVSLVLFNLHTQDVEHSDVNLIDVESIVLILAMLSSLEDVHIKAVRIVWICAFTLESSVVVSVSTVSMTAANRYH